VQWNTIISFRGGLDAEKANEQENNSGLPGCFIHPALEIVDSVIVETKGKHCLSNDAQDYVYLFLQETSERVRWTLAISNAGHKKTDLNY
jgi:hypothetical protein